MAGAHGAGRTGPRGAPDARSACETHIFQAAMRNLHGWHAPRSLAYCIIKHHIDYS